MDSSSKQNEQMDAKINTVNRKGSSLLSDTFLETKWLLVRHVTSPLYTVTK
jgi:hypothetical protein